MTILLISLALLVGGYCIYGLLVEKVFGIDPKRLTPARSRTDGVDYVELPTWKVFLIQFLNIAGLGPIFGAIMGVMFGPMAFIWIVFGSIFGGAVHDFISAMMSLRSGGDSLPELVGRELGPVVKQAMRFISIVLLVLVGAVFVLTPAGLLDNMTPALLSTNFWIVVIFLYYILATLLPIDKLIGRFYPIFGFVLLFMAVGLLGVMLFGDVAIPDGFSYGLYSRHSAADTHPIFPMMFVSIACGAVSGFHATQSPMMARCLKNEKLARPVFYGAMIAEGLVALIWAAAAIAFTGGYGELSEYMAAHNGAGDLVADISVGWLRTFGRVLAILVVGAAPTTTGGTSLRSARLIAADVLHIDQSKLMRRLMVSLPLFAIAFGLMCIDFNILWRYFAWTNQLLAAFTLWAATVYLARHRRLYIVTLIPALFMTMVVVSYILVAPSPEGFGLPEPTALYAGAAADGICLLLFARYEVLRRSGRLIHEVSY